MENAGLNSCESDFIECSSDTSKDVRKPEPTFTLRPKARGFLLNLTAFIIS